MGNGHTSWMPVYWRDFLADTSHLSPAELGAYTSLFASYWVKAGPLPSDPDQLRRIARMDAAEWAAVSPRVVAFFEIREGRWVHPKIEEALAEAESRYSRRSDAGKRGGRPARKQSRSIASEIPSAHESKAFPREYQAESKAQESPDGDSSPASKRNVSEEADLNIPDFLDRRNIVNGTRIAPNWQPNEADQANAAEQGLEPGTIANVTEQFRDYWKARGGKDGLKLDWSATWRTWVRNHIANHGRGPWPGDGRQRSGSNGPNRGSAIAAARSLIADGEIRLPKE